MKLYGIFIFMLIATICHGQQGAQGATSNLAAADRSIIMGHFEINKMNEQRGITEHINVNYELSHAPFIRSLNLQLRTADPLMLTAEIIDKNGDKLIHWVPKAKSYLYKEAIDVSKLPAGDYKMNIYSEFSGEVVFSIPFQKEGNKN